MRKQNEFRWKKIKLMPGEDRVTDAAGLGALVEVFDESPLAKGFKEALCRRSSNRSLGGYRLGLIQVSSFIYGHDALDDLEEFRGDPLFEAALKGEVAAPRTMGDFLRCFEERHIEKLNQFLVRMSHSYREHLKKVLPDEHKPGPLVLDIDSTPHEQHGKKMEGLAWNYKDQWCLDSQVIFDERGFAYGMQLRSGNTKSGVGAGALIEQGFSGTKYTDEKYLRGDSAYCNQEVMRVCLNKGVKFTLTAHDAITQWRSSLDEVTDWREWEYSEKEKEKAQKKEDFFTQGGNWAISLDALLVRVFKVSHSGKTHVGGGKTQPTIHSF